MDRAWLAGELYKFEITPPPIGEDLIPTLRLADRRLPSRGVRWT